MPVLSAAAKLRMSVSRPRIMLKHFTYTALQSQHSKVCRSVMPGAELMPRTMSTESSLALCTYPAYNVYAVYGL